MKCISKIQAERVAMAGAAKMDRLGYDYRRSRSGAGVLYVRNPDGARYRVNLDPAAPSCDCAFFADNAQFGTCKHLIWGREQMAFELWVDEQEAMLDEMYPVIPPATSRPAICPHCGSSNPFDNDSTCPHCEDYAQG
jgi:hypothetical protein